MIRVLVADDSFLMRRLIKEMLESDPDITVVGLAKDGLDAIQKAKELSPDVITLDLEMPVMSGMDALAEIMRTNPTPIIMLSAYTKRGSPEAISSLGYGAVDFVSKPSGPVSKDIEKVKAKLIRQIKIASIVDAKKFNRDHIRAKKKSPSYSDKVVVIGASSGGPLAVQKVLYSLPKDFPSPILVVQHMPAQFTKEFAKRLNNLCKIRVKEGEDGDVLESGLAIVAPGGKHMGVKKVGEDVKIHLSSDAPVNNSRPSVDVMMLSAVQIYGPRTIGVILSGMGRDGARGMKEIKDVGGQTIAQDEKTSLIYGMPKAVIDEGAAKYVLPIDSIGNKIMSLL